MDLFHPWFDIADAANAAASAIEEATPGSSLEVEETAADAARKYLVGEGWPEAAAIAAAKVVADVASCGADDEYATDTVSGAMIALAAMTNTMVVVGGRK